MISIIAEYYRQAYPLKNCKNDSMIYKLFCGTNDFLLFPQLITFLIYISTITNVFNYFACGLTDSITLVKRIVNIR